ncbi:MAG: hypothetical protein RKO25_15105 [Candidatus Contendobacter sp.]|nr:hypothetical protein [Candidatus Contendobacter sp.]
MRKLVNLVIILLVIVVLLVVAAGGYLWYSTKQDMDRIVTMAAPLAEISYGGINISLTGSVGVNQLRIKPHAINDAITIGAVRLNVHNFLDLFNIRWQLSQNQLPETLSLAFQDLEMPLSDGILNTILAGRAAKKSPFAHLDALGCGPVTAFGAAEWREMGYDRFVGNMEVGYRIDAKNNMLKLFVDGNLRDRATLNLDIDLTWAKLPESPTDLAFAFAPKLAKLNFVLRDDGFNQRRNAYCAAKAGKPLPEYLADHVQQVVERLRANGILPSTGLIAAYQSYLNEGGTLTITVSPPVPINPAELHRYAPTDAVQLLGLRIKANEVAVADVPLDWDAAKVVKALDIKPEPKPEPEPESPPPPAPAPTPPTPVEVEKVYQTYHPTPVGDLNRYVGKIIRLRTASGAQYRGRLDAISEDKIRVTVHKSGGSAVLSLRANEITETEVLY